MPAKIEENKLSQKDYEIEELLSMNNFHNLIFESDECKVIQ